MSLTGPERETTIRLGDDTDHASVWTCQPKVARRLQKRGVKPTEVSKQDGREIAWRFLVPARWVKISPPRRVVLSDKDRQARADRMSNLTRKKTQPAKQDVESRF